MASVNTTGSNPSAGYSPYATISSQSTIGRLGRGAREGSLPKSMSYLNFRGSEHNSSPADSTPIHNKSTFGATGLPPPGSCASSRSASWCPEIGGNPTAEGDVKGG